MPGALPLSQEFVWESYISLAKNSIALIVLKNDAVTMRGGYMQVEFGIILEG